MSKRILTSKRKQAGFSLVEIMVAVVISMLAMAVVLKVFGNSEMKKRATTGGNDALTGGVLALAGLQRNVSQAGYGFMSVPILGCDVVLRSGVTLQRLAPVTINHDAIPDGDPNTDTLLVAYGVANSAPEGDMINTQPSDTSYAMRTPAAFALNDWVIAAPGTRPAACSLKLDQVKTVANASDPFVIGVHNGFPNVSFGTLFNLGHDPADATRGPQLLAYAVRNGNLTVCDYMANNCGDDATKNDPRVWNPVAANIVSMRAQYGRGTPTALAGVVDIYDQTTPDPASTTYACDIVRVAAVRLALVARSADFDKDQVTTAMPTWEASTAGNPAGSAAAPIVLSNAGLPGGTTWQNYRYKVLKATVPIRTATWAGEPSGC